MQKSFWGRTSSINSLTRNLRIEVKEFIQACQNNDSVNAKEEAADVLMILLCMLYRILDVENYHPDEIVNRVTEKLHWRYKHLYANDSLQEGEEELNKWVTAKEIEHKMNLMFCENNECFGFKKIGLESIEYVDGEYWCKLCKNAIVPSKKNVLFHGFKRAGLYIKEICESIVAYADGDYNSAVVLSNDHPDAFKALCNQFLTESENNNALVIFAEYLHRKYHIAYNDTKSYFECVRKIQNQLCFKSSLCEKYYKRISSTDYLAKNHFTIGEWQKIMQEVNDLTFDVVKKIEKTVSFNARNWDNQVIHKYLLRYPNRNSTAVIECMTLIHYDGAKVRDLTIELSNMYNCIVGCRFCASGALPGEVQYLEALDYVRQLNTCLSQSGINPNDFDNFYVSFAGIGEPSIVYENIAAGIVMIRDIYPRVQFNIATFGWQAECFDHWKKLDLPIRTLQIPLYHTEISVLKDIVAKIPKDYEFSKIIKAAVDYRSVHPECRIKINYIPMKGINDSDTDVSQFIHMMEPFKDDITIKVSFLNYTRPAEKNGFVTPGIERLTEIQTKLKFNGFSAYVFGTANNTSLGCGQLSQDCISGNI